VKKKDKKTRVGAEKGGGPLERERWRHYLRQFVKLREGFRGPSRELEEKKKVRIGNRNKRKRD